MFTTFYSGVHGIGDVGIFYREKTMAFVLREKKNKNEARLQPFGWDLERMG